MNIRPYTWLHWTNLIPLGLSSLCVARFIWDTHNLMLCGALIGAGVALICLGLVQKAGE